jgi:beta-glucanase (GH16 family)
MKNTYCTAVLLFSGLILLNIACVATPKNAQGKTREKLVWSEEFNYTGAPDSTKWSYDLGDGCPQNCGWGNNELQYYTKRRENARVENGCLIIETHREKMGKYDYSSARMASKYKGDWKYGRIEARAKLPKGLGTWSAIWMLPTDWVYGGWPRSGEIDIMENVGFMPDSAIGTIHTDRYNGMLGTQISGGANCKTLSTEFHNYSIEWTADKIDFLFDGKVFQSFPNKHQDVGTWPFDQRFHLMMNIAVGGNWGGQKGVDTGIWPQRMEVDWVRVYQRG